jgi:hypothetical protein
MNEDISEQLGQILLAEMGRRSALECGIEAILMFIGSTKPESIEPVQGLIQKLAEDKWEGLEDGSKPSFQDYASRLLSVLEMTRNS